MFIDGHKQPKVIENQNCFFTKIKELKSYMVKFNEDGTMKAKNYLVDYIVREKKWCLIIIMTYDRYTFFVNDRIRKV